MLAVALFLLVLTATAEQPNEALRLIAFNETHTEWMTPAQVFKLAVDNVKFMDITDFQTITHKSPKVFAIPSRPAFENIVNPLLQELDIEELVGSLVILSNNFATRYYTSQTGLAAAQFLIEEYIKRAAGRNDITISRFQHSWVQPSIIVRIQGTGPKADEIVILGGHIDSVSNGATAPGADDDGSGSVTVLEVFRVLAQLGFRPQRTIEFHGYSGEEAGLLGSNAIATAYAQQGVNVFGMVQLDMTGYFRAGTTESIGIVTDYTNPQLNEFIRQLVLTYTDLPYVNKQCGYACSDHASWNRNGYASAFPHEAGSGNTNPNIHTVRDTINILNPSHMLQIAKLALSYVVEMSLAD